MIEGVVGLFEKVLHAYVVWLSACCCSQTDGDGDLERGVVVGDSARFRGDAFAKPFRRDNGVSIASGIEDQEESFSAKAPEAITAAGFSTETMGYLSQHLVAGQVTVAVVVDFKKIDIQ